MPSKLTKIDLLILDQHGYLREEDECHYLLEWTKGGGYKASSTNQLIANLKIASDQKGRPRYHYKQQAILQAAQLLRSAINPEFLARATLVPVPPSACKHDPAYDDRMCSVLNHLGTNLDVRELVLQVASMTPSHLSGDYRATPEEIAANYRIDESLATPEPTLIGIFDDVLTAGAHFKAIQSVLGLRFPQATIVGVFLARRIFPPGP